jgi:serine phosphatase RsbU (regulator of sigma subunit)
MFRTQLLNKAFKKNIESQSQMTLETAMIDAGKIQQSILPQVSPILKNYEISAFMCPAYSVGGDFYDFIPVLSGPKTLGLVVGDVVGKGISAALYMMLAQGKLRSGLSLVNFTPKRTLLWLNSQLIQQTEDMSITMIYGVLDTKLNEFNYARAGHERPYLIDTSGNFLYKNNSRLGQPLGQFNNPVIESNVYKIPSGATLILYSDGLIDETNSDNHIFGRERLEELLVNNRKSNANEISTKILDELSDYRGNTRQYDDATIMVVKRDY